MFTIFAALFKEHINLEKVVVTRTIIFSVPVEGLESNGLLRALARSSSLAEFASRFQLLILKESDCKKIRRSII